MLFHPREEEGQGLVEYAFILVLVALASIAVVFWIGPAIGNVYSSIINAI